METNTAKRKYRDTPMAVSDFLREETMKDILALIVCRNNTFLPTLESGILRAILTENKSVSELAEKHKLPRKRIVQIFESSAERLRGSLSTLPDKLANVSATQKEIETLKRKLEQYETRRSELLTLPAETIELLEMNIEDLDLSSRVINICRYNDIYSLADLVRISERDFLRLRNAGKNSLEEVSSYLSSKGLKWRMKI